MTEDVFREVEVLCRLGDAALRDERDLVEHVGVAVVVSALERRGQRALHQRAKAQLRARGELAQQAEVAEDVLSEADDGGRLAAERAATLELTQRVGHLEGLLDVALLVAVDGLQDRAAAEGQRGVLVVALAVS